MKTRNQIERCNEEYIKQYRATLKDIKFEMKNILKEYRVKPRMSATKIHKITKFKLNIFIHKFFLLKFHKKRMEVDILYKFKSGNHKC